MSKISRCFWLLLALSGVLLMLGCGSSNFPPLGLYQVVTVSDIHFNPLYDQTLYSSLVAADASHWAGIFQGSKITAPTGGGTDTDYPLLVLALADMKRHMGNSPVVLFTGDLLGHYIPQNFYAAYYHATPTTYPPPDSTAIAAMQQFIDKTFAFVAAQIRASVGNAPVLYAPGNIDTYGPGLGPDSTFLANNAASVYNLLLNGSVDESTFLGTFTSDGYYSAERPGSPLRVIGLNTNSFVDIAPSITRAPAELEWLNSQLASAQAAGQKVWILMHVPPGANSQTTAQNAAKAGTPNQVNESTTAMMWDSGYQATFMQTLAKYPKVVTLMLAGHTHMDEYRILPSGNVLLQLPSISPCFGNNPAYKVLTMTPDMFLPTDYESFDYNLATMPAQFHSLYTLSSTYGARGPLSDSLERLYPQLVSIQSRRNAYTYYYASGSTGKNPLTKAPWNPINAGDWPIFSCTISKADEPDYIECVNTY